MQTKKSTDIYNINMINKYEYMEENEFATIINDDVEFTGKIEAQEPNLVKGIVTESNIQASLLVVIKDGKVAGEIKCDVLSVLGECEGELRIKEMLVLLKGGRIKGTIRTNNLIIDEGGIFHGECIMNVPSTE